ncbi:hypothetical protein ACWDUN_09835 [Mycobacterium sp. NPDC003323]
MRLRYLPYATRPGRLLAQIISDVMVIAWTVAWVMVGSVVYAAVATIAEVGRQVQEGADGVSGSLGSAGDSVDDVPLVGDGLSGPLRAAAEAAAEIAGAGQNLDSTATWLAWVLAIAVAATPIVTVGLPWLFLRIRFFRRKLTVLTLASTHAGQELLAMRALANRPLAKLTAVDPDPIGAWRRDDRPAIRGLALLELHAAGVRLS